MLTKKVVEKEYMTRVIESYNKIREIYSVSVYFKIFFNLLPSIYKELTMMHFMVK